MDEVNEKSYQSRFLTYDYNKKCVNYTDDDGKRTEEEDTGISEFLIKHEICSEKACEKICGKIKEAVNSCGSYMEYIECFVKGVNARRKWNRIGIIYPENNGRVYISFTDISQDRYEMINLSHNSRCDDLTGLFKREEFIKAAMIVCEKNGSRIVTGEYAMVYLDIIRFKAVNDIYGREEGDRLLIYVSNVIRQNSDREDVYCRLEADRFVLFTHCTGEKLEMRINKMLDEIAMFDASMEILCNVGIYITGGEIHSIDSMIGKAALALSGIKGSYTARCSYYTEELRNDMLDEQEIVGMMRAALRERQFVVYYQPQYDHSTGMIVGAEALIRWKHPQYGIISPGKFIPIFEKNGFITNIDLYVFKEVCCFLRTNIDEGIPIVPISSNFSRHDIFKRDFVEKLEEIRKEYDIDTKYLRIEITESSVMGNSRQTNEVIQKLHKHGYIVEMDDFGSGYSSLNVLKDIDLDVIKLDMLFLEQQEEGSRGGTILSSVIRMAKWLNMPVIAEGVETMPQADFLKSIGCDYIQGYLYSKPLPEENYREILKKNYIKATVPESNFIENLNAYDFWNPVSLETLIFSNYVGGAAIFDYHDGEIEILRLNEKYLSEIGMNLTEKEIIESDPLVVFDDTNKKIYMDMLKKAIETGEEQECETWRTLSSKCCGKEKICLRTNVRMIGKSDEIYLFYAMVRNITAEKTKYMDIADSERRFKMASEQVNIYYWEYTVATREMRPCFRCMRDLGLPALLTNYPDSAIEMGVFPPEVADMYRDWHRQIEEGVPQLEAVMPLTVGRVPFHVRYTTEFDENGRPVKAYGSAALVVDIYQE